MNETALIERATTNEVIGAFYDVYNTLGFGFLEFVYSLALERELVRRGCSVEREVPISLHYKGELLTAYRLDMLVDRKVVVEIKSTQVLPSSTQRQTLNYLRATDLEVALILHFGPKPEFIRLVHSNRVL
jgi:GxxExxY protein